MPKDAAESGHQIHLTREQAERYLRKRMGQFLEGTRTKRSYHLAGDLFVDTYWTGKTTLKSIQDVVNHHKNPWED